MASKLRMDMILNLKDKVTRGLKKVEQGVDKVQKKVEKLNKTKVNVKGSVNVGGGGAGGPAAGAAKGGGLLTPILAALAAWKTKSASASKKELESYRSLGREAKKRLVSEAGANRLIKQRAAIMAKMRVLGAHRSAFNVDPAIRKRWNQLRTQLADTKKEFDAIGTKANNASQKASSGITRFIPKVGALGVAATGAAAAITALGAAFAAAFVHAARVGPKFEKMRATLAGLVPESTNAGEAFAFINEVTKKMPASLDEVTESYTRLISMGIAPTEERLLAYSNIASNTGKTILQFAEAVADGLTGEFERFKLFGIKVTKEADGYVARMGETVVATGKTTTQVVNNIEKLGKAGGKFFGANERHMETYEGKISNLGVAWDRLGDVIWQAALQDLFKDAADAVASFVEWLTKAFLATYKFFASLDLYDKAVAQLTRVMMALDDAFTWEEATEWYEKRVAAIDEATVAMRKEIDALMDGTAAAEKHNEALKDMEKTKTGSEPLVIKINEGEFSKFFRGLRQSAQDTIQLEENLWKAQDAADELFQQGAMSSQEYMLVIEEIKNQLDSLEGETKDVTDKTTEFWRQAARNMQDAMGNTFFDWMQGKTGDMVGDFKRMIDRMVAELLASKLLTFMLGDFAGGGALGGLVGKGAAALGFRADGGPVTAGQPYIVGERGPELFTPTTSGHVTPNHELGGTNVNINISAMDGADVRRTLEKERRWIAEMVGGAGKTYNLRTA